MGDPAIGWSKDDVLEVRNLSLRIPKEKGNEYGEKDTQHCQNLPSHPCKKDAEDNEWD
jgi:hypothetical protein